MKFSKPQKEKAARTMRAALAFALIFAVFLALALFPPRNKSTPQAAEKTVVRVWNVDTFEGGTGSRTAFLSRAARRTEEALGNVYFYVTSYSAEGFAAALGRGELPDVLSFGVGLGDFSRLCLPLKRAFAGGETADGPRAAAWCAGEYVLFSLDGDFSAAGKTAVSRGGSNLSAVAAAFAGVEGEEIGSIEAYTGFLSGKYRYLFGTQRDRRRLLSRGVEASERPLGAFCDLYQYLAVLSEERRAEGTAFLETLLSEEVQASLGEIGMRSVREEEGAWTVNVFTPPEALAETEEAARRGDLIKFPDKYLKKV